MNDRIRPGDRQHPERLAVVATITLDVELLLLTPHPVHPRIDTVVRYGNQLAVINGAPSAAPLPARLGPEMTAIGQVYVKPWGFGIGPDQITNLQAEQRSVPKPTPRLAEDRLQFAKRMQDWAEKFRKD